MYNDPPKELPQTRMHFGSTANELGAGVWMSCVSIWRVQCWAIAPKTPDALMKTVS